MSSPSQPSRPTWTVPGYVVEDLLGSGGSGQVWRARVAGTEGRVALKRIPLGDAGQVQAARAEAAMLATLDHPNLIRLHELVALPDAAALVLDLADGGSLAQLLGVRGRLTPGEVIGALAPIGAALAYAHNAGVTHGDVSPANVLFTDFGLPLLADLGVARLVGDTAPVRSTPGYVDPTVAAGLLPGPHSDVFMLAAVAVHALTGHPLWAGETAEQALAAARAGEVDAAARLEAAGVPPAIRDVLCAALDPDPTRRGTAAEFALELRHAGEPVAVELSAGRVRLPPSTAPRPPAPALTRGVRVRPLAPRPVRRPLWRRRWVQATAALLIAGGLGVGLVTLPRHTHGAAAAAAVTSPPPVIHTSMPTVVPTTEPTVVPTTHPTVAPTASPTAVQAIPDPAPESGRSAVATARDALARLDATRALAYARREPALLRQVYLAGSLLDADTALLTRIVPPGCGLVGAYTRYARLSLVESTTTRLVVTATTTVAESELSCGGVDKGRAPAVGPQPLRIELQRGGNGYRIASLRAA